MVSGRFPFVPYRWLAVGYTWGVHISLTVKSHVKLGEGVAIGYEF